MLFMTSLHRFNKPSLQLSLANVSFYKMHELMYFQWFRDFIMPGGFITLILNIKHIKKSVVYYFSLTGLKFLDCNLIGTLNYLMK